MDNNYSFFNACDILILSNYTLTLYPYPITFAFNILLFLSQSDLEFGAWFFFDCIRDLYISRKCYSLVCMNVTSCYSWNSSSWAFSSFRREYRKWRPWVRMEVPELRWLSDSLSDSNVTHCLLLFLSVLACFRLVAIALSIRVRKSSKELSEWSLIMKRRPDRPTCDVGDDWDWGVKGPPLLALGLMFRFESTSPLPSRILVLPWWLVSSEGLQKGLPDLLIVLRAEGERESDSNLTELGLLKQSSDSNESLNGCVQCLLTVLDGLV